MRETKENWYRKRERAEGERDTKDRHKEGGRERCKEDKMKRRNDQRFGKKKNTAQTTAVRRRKERGRYS